MPFLLVAACLALWRAGELAQRSRRGRRALALAAPLLLASSWLAGASAWQRGQGAGEWHALHPEFHRAARWIALHTRPDVVVGAWNAGILSWFSDRTVVNLDGVMNDEALEALRARRLAAYLEQRRIGLLVDSAGEIARFMEGYGGDPAWRTRFARIQQIPPLVLLARRSQPVLLVPHGPAGRDPLLPPSPAER
jgi:hypothetical protein